jgi:hypothetical protein
VQAGKLLGILAQGAHAFSSSYSFVLQATLPEFPRRRIQKNRWPGAQQLAVILLGESATAERNYTIAMEGVRQQIVQRTGFSGPESGLSLEAKNFGNRLPLASLNAGIEIHKVPG